VRAELRVVSGSLVYVEGESRRAMSAGETQALAAQVPHHLEDCDDASIEVSFFRT